MKWVVKIRLEGEGRPPIAPPICCDGVDQALRRGPASRSATTPASEAAIRMTGDEGERDSDADEQVRMGQQDPIRESSRGPGSAPYQTIGSGSAAQARGR
jgi:hypothetical protein